MPVPTLRRLPLLLPFALALAACGVASSGSSPDAPATSAATDGDSHADGIGILLDLARQALQERRLIAPAGANAVEFYLSVLELDPANATAREQLAAAMPQAMALVEQAINRRELDEAARELRLLREADDTNFTVQLLAGKLDAQRAIVTREHEARAALLQARADAAVLSQPRPGNRP